MVPVSAADGYAYRRQQMVEALAQLAIACVQAGLGGTAPAAEAEHCDIQTSLAKFAARQVAGCSGHL